MVSRWILTLGIIAVIATALAAPAAAFGVAKIGDFVWLDLNEDGIQDSINEPGVQGVTVTLHRVSDGYQWTTTTNAHGYYKFVKKGAEFYLVFDLPTGYEFSPQNAGSDDTVDSDANVNTGRTQNFTVHNGSEDMTWDAGIYIPAQDPGIELEKTADASVVPPGAQVTYTYRVKNIGAVTLYNVTITDDNGTPGDTTDDFVVATIPSLNPGEEKTYTYTVTLTFPMCDPDAGQVGTFSTQLLPSGDVKFTYTQSKHLIDNTYGVNTSPLYGKEVKFRERVGSDKAQFSLTNGDGDQVLDFHVDYISEAASYPSGYGTLGVTGGDGSMHTGDPAHILSCNTSLSDNLNQSPAFYGYTVDSPPEPNASWDYYNSYTVVVSAAAFGPSGFGSVTVNEVHNSPGGRYEPEPCEDCIKNIATVTATTGDGQTLTASDWAEVCVTGGGPSPGKGEVEIKKTAKPNRIQSGDQVTYTYEVKNTGPVTLHNLTVIDDNGTPGLVGDDFLVGTAASLDPNKKVTFSVTLTLTVPCPSSKQDVVNIATVTGTDDNGKPVTDSDDAKVSVSGCTPSTLSMTKTASPATVVTYTYTIENTGPSPLANITVTDDNGTPGDTSDDFLVGTVASLAPGAQTTLSVTLTITSSSQSVTNIATAIGTDTGTGRTVTATAQATVTVSVSQ